MDAYDHDKVFSYIDQAGRYAYNNQPAIGLWNLTRLAESLLPLLADDTDVAVGIAQGILESYISSYEGHWLEGMRAKCGLTATADNTIAEADKALIEELLNTMAQNNADFTLTFYYLSQLSADDPEQDNDIRSLFDRPAQFDEWLHRWRERLGHEIQDNAQRQASMQAVNPVYIPRNHQIEAAIRAAEDHNDFSVFHALHEVLQEPYLRQAGKDNYMLPPEPEELVTQTFCGT
jgi:uncharacterized protein YdiU (UPF0061 family)